MSQPTTLKCMMSTEYERATSGRGRLCSHRAPWYATKSPGWAYTATDEEYAFRDRLYSAISKGQPSCRSSAPRTRVAETWCRSGRSRCGCTTAPRGYTSTLERNMTFMLVDASLTPLHRSSKSWVCCSTCSSTGLLSTSSMHAARPNTESNCMKTALFTFQLMRSQCLVKPPPPVSAMRRCNTPGVTACCNKPPPRGLPAWGIRTDLRQGPDAGPGRAPAARGSSRILPAGCLVELQPLACSPLLLDPGSGGARAADERLPSRQQR
mmetsp:Transcript_57447/g.145677  ORF Transcript_57447/g.145677 Transcript_57447/m.145677 type:complete len:266 (-) Transcript_57447:8-805(-)